MAGRQREEDDMDILFPLGEGRGEEGFLVSDQQQVGTQDRNTSSDAPTLIAHPTGRDNPPPTEEDHILSVAMPQIQRGIEVGQSDPAQAAQVLVNAFRGIMRGFVDARMHSSNDGGRGRGRGRGKDISPSSVSSRARGVSTSKGKDQLPKPVPKIPLVLDPKLWTPIDGSFTLVQRCMKQIVKMEWKDHVLWSDVPLADKMRVERSIKDNFQNGHEMSASYLRRQIQSSMTGARSHARQQVRNMVKLLHPHQQPTCPPGMDEVVFNAFLESEMQREAYMRAKAAQAALDSLLAGVEGNLLDETDPQVQAAQAKVERCNAYSQELGEPPKELLDAAARVEKRPMKVTQIYGQGGRPAFVAKFATLYGFQPEQKHDDYVRLHGVKMLHEKMRREMEAAKELAEFEDAELGDWEEDEDEDDDEDWEDDQDDEDEDEDDDPLVPMARGSDSLTKDNSESAEEVQLGGLPKHKKRRTKNDIRASKLAKNLTPIMDKSAGVSSRGSRGSGSSRGRVSGSYSRGGGSHSRGGGSQSGRGSSLSSGWVSNTRPPSGDVVPASQDLAGISGGTTRNAKLKTLQPRATSEFRVRKKSSFR